jgi:UDP-4-amino-4,6-dideoxy-N-acetyl-beta-L-altrosamine N-acetyltransferase
MDVQIRPISNQDTQNIIKWRNNPSVQKNFIFRTPLNEKLHSEWMQNKVEKGEVAQFIIRDKSSNQDVGSVYLRDIDHCNKKAEFGIFIGEDEARGKNIGTQSTSLILQHAFEQLDLNKVFLRVFDVNTGAIKSYEKSGFVKEGLFRQDVIIDNHPYNVIFMGILKEDWMKQNG